MVPFDALTGPPPGTNPEDQRGWPAYAEADKRLIHLQAFWFIGHPQDMGAVVHEMIHVIQDYKGVPREVGWLTEGIADYARARLAPQNRAWAAGCRYGERFDTTTYGCAAAFLVYLDGLCPDTTAKLHAALASRRFGKIPGLLRCQDKPIIELWDQCIAGPCRHPFEYQEPAAPASQDSSSQAPSSD